ncbi:MAG: alanine racemase [Pseudomonadales bacterium]
MTARLTVDLDALGANYRRFALAGRNSGAVVKANAYGLGLSPVAHHLHGLGCRHFFVATVAEGVDLRRQLSADDTCIHVFSGPVADTLKEIRHWRLLPVLNSEAQIALWQHSGGGAADLHVDTGMHRLGVPWDRLDTLDIKAFYPKLVLTHLACADTPEHPLNERQLTRFQAALAHFPGVPASLGGSAALLGSPLQADRNLVNRPGIGLYGGNPLSTGPNPMRTVATLEGQILQLRDVPSGESVGYGGTHVCETQTRVATVGIGYADGVPRGLSGRGAYLFHDGVRCPLLGRVSMDLVQVDVTGTRARPGDWLEIYGHHVSVDEIASLAQTISYEVFTRIGARVTRRYETGGVAAVH